MSSRCFVIDGSSCGCGGSGLLVTGPGLIATGSGLIATGGTATILVWNIVADSTKCSGFAAKAFLYALPLLSICFLVFVLKANSAGCCLQTGSHMAAGAKWSNNIFWKCICGLHILDFC